MILLVSSTFLVQNRYYASQRLHAGTHDNARSATERVAGEIRSVMADGFVVAGPRTLTVRSPMVVGMICSRQGNDYHVHFEGGVDGLGTGDVAGVAIRDEVSGAWTYQASSWGALDGGGTVSASRCAAEGADTVGASSEFRALENLQVLFGSPPDAGTTFLLYRETTFKFEDSVLDPGRLGLFRRINAGPLVEFATGMDATAQFQYRTGGSTYADTVLSASLADIDGVRIVADARLPAATGGQSDVTFGWEVNVGLRNVP